MFIKTNVYVLMRYIRPTFLTYYLRIWSIDLTSVNNLHKYWLLFDICFAGKKSTRENYIECNPYVNFRTLENYSGKLLIQFQER